MSRKRYVREISLVSTIECASATELAESLSAFCGLQPVVLVEPTDYLINIRNISQSHTTTCTAMEHQEFEIEDYLQENSFDKFMGKKYNEKVAILAIFGSQ